MQNDMLKEFIAQKEWICPPEPAVRIVVDMIEFCAKHGAALATRSRSRGYHIREAGATAVQELAFTLADGIGYVEAGVERGLPSTTSRRGSRSSSTSTTTSSRRSPSSARRAASGRGS